MNLRMDVDQAKATLGTLRTCLTELQSELGKSKSAVDNLVPAAWESPSANQFESQFRSWASAADNSLNELETLATRLDYEIQQWLEVAARL